jgi:pyrroline-5-carboxylate reductase
MRVGLIGAGNMARAMARGWGDPVLCTDSGSGRAAALAEELGGEAVASNAELAGRADLVVLCHKPAQLESVARELASAPSRPVASVLGGVSSAALAAAYPGRPLFRLMPNTPVEVRRGVIAYTPSADVDPELEARVRALLERLGSVVALPDEAMEAATATAGVGPAYVALMVEAQADAAAARGLSAEQATELVVETMAGTAALLAARGNDAVEVRREVTSPGGSTERGLAALEGRDIRVAFQEAFDAVVGGGR